MANDKAEDLSIKKLTKGAPLAEAKLAAIKSVVSGIKVVASVSADPGKTVNAGNSVAPESDEDKSA